MFAFFRVLSVTDLMPRLYCLRGAPGILWLPVASDGLIVAGYFAILLVLFQVATAVVLLRFKPLLLSMARPKDDGAGIETGGETGIEPSPDAAGQLCGLAHLKRDLAESREMEAKYRMILEAAPDAMLMNNPQGRIVYVNRRMTEVFGFSRAELLGQSVDVLIPERLRAERERNRKTHFEKQVQLEMGQGGQYLCLRKDGTEFPVEASITPLETVDGPLILASIRDVTERRKAEMRFRGLLESAPDAMVISKAQGEIEMVNLQAQRLFGYTAEEMIGQRVEMLIPPDLKAAYRGDSPAIVRGELKETAGLGVDLRARRKDGTEIPVEISFSPLEGPDGTSVTAAIRDISDRKQAENRFRSLLESAPDAMVIVNSAGIIELVNAETERLFGYGREEMLGQSLEILVPEHLHGTHKANTTEFLRFPKQRQMGVGLDLWARRKDGSPFPVEISLSPLEGPGGFSVTAAIRDISERRQAARLLAEKMGELSRSNEELEQFAYIASHDLQEPLRMVASYTQLLARRYVGKLDADADEFIGYAVDGTRRMKRLIEDLLVYSRAGKGTPPMEEVWSGTALQGALNNLHTAIAESGATVTHDSLPKIVGHELQLVQVFQNLIGNAIKYRREEALLIHVSSDCDEKEWRFSVSDNGIGIESQFFDRIFVIFQRLHGRGEYEGTGIGLAICKRILQRQGGRIWVESKIGEGSTFHFSLPKR